MQRDKRASRVSQCLRESRKSRSLGYKRVGVFYTRPRSSKRIWLTKSGVVETRRWKCVFSWSAALNLRPFVNSNTHRACERNNNSCELYRVHYSCERAFSFFGLLKKSLSVRMCTYKASRIHVWDYTLRVYDEILQRPVSPRFNSAERLFLSLQLYTFSPRYIQQSHDPAGPFLIRARVQQSQWVIVARARMYFACKEIPLSVFSFGVGVARGSAV